MNEWMKMNEWFTFDLFRADGLDSVLVVSWRVDRAVTKWLFFFLRNNSVVHQTLILFSVCLSEGKKDDDKICFYIFYYYQLIQLESIYHTCRYHIYTFYHLHLLSIPSHHLSLFSSLSTAHRYIYLSKKNFLTSKQTLFRHT